MNRAFLWPAALLGLAAFAAPALAQFPGRFSGGAAGGAAGQGFGDFDQEGKPASALASNMQEDIEIMRRLLDGAFAEAYGPTPPIHYYPLIGPAQLSDDGRLTLAKHMDSAAPHTAAPHTEGVYLKDYGVVYTVTLPPTGFDSLPRNDPGTSGKAPPDDWDRIRKEIHGEAPAPETKNVPAHPPLSSVILKVLADNGKHFDSLGDGERISVAVTFRGTANCANCHGIPPAATWQNLPSDYYSFPPGGGPPGTPGSLGVPPPGVISGPPPGSAPSAPTEVGTQMTLPAEGTPEWLTDVRNAILLGDLHLKQGKTKEAIDAYMNALKQAEEGLDHKRISQEGYNQGDLPVLLMSVELCNKVAQACVAAGKEEQARGMLQNASRLAKEAEKLTGGRAGSTGTAPATTVAASPAPLPPKLVVTASKKLLDDVGSGKMTFEAFSKAATVEYVNPPADKK